MGEVPRGDGADDADGLTSDRAPGRDTHRRRLAEILVVFVGFGGIGREAKSLTGTFELSDCGEHPRRADFGDGQVAQLLEVLLHRLAQLADAPHPQLGVARPVSVVEGPSGRLDGPAHVVSAGIGRGTQDFLGGRVDRGKCALAAARQLAVDEQRAHAVGQQCHLCLRRLVSGHMSGIVQLNIVVASLDSARAMLSCQP